MPSDVEAATEIRMELKSRVPCERILHILILFAGCWLCCGLTLLVVTLIRCRAGCANFGAGLL